MRHRTLPGISLPPPFLESRQSTRTELNVSIVEFATPVFGIKAKPSAAEQTATASLPPPFLESRQSRLGVYIDAKPVCHPRFWNQGKADVHAADHARGVCHPRFWNQGKALTAGKSLI